MATVDAAAQSAVELGTAVVTCKGNADDIARLGSLCAATPVPTSMSSAAAGSLLMTAAASTGPALLVYAFRPAGVSADTVKWPPSGVRYAAFLVLSPPASGDADAAWSSGDPLAGTLGASAIADEACTEAWRGGGELHWRSVTITVDWSADIPC